MARMITVAPTDTGAAAKALHEPPLPIVLLKASRPLSHAHVVLLEIIAESIVHDYLCERDGGERGSDSLVREAS